MNYPGESTVRDAWPCITTRTGGMTMHSLNATLTAPRGAVISKVLQLSAAFFLGAVVLYGAVLVQTPAVHTAAHDMRHSAGFPCH